MTHSPKICIDLVVTKSCWIWQENKFNNANRSNYTHWVGNDAQWARNFFDDKWLKARAARAQQRLLFILFQACVCSENNVCVHWFLHNGLQIFQFISIFGIRFSRLGKNISIYKKKKLLTKSFEKDQCVSKDHPERSSGCLKRQFCITRKSPWISSEPGISLLLCHSLTIIVAAWGTYCI